MTRDTTYFRTGIRLIDMVTGGAKGTYGFPAGRIINICGDKSTGKTFICNELIANAYYTYGEHFKWMYADCERGYSFDTRQLYGIDIHTEESDAPSNVEEAFYCIDRFAKSLKEGEFGIYVLDSLDALTCDEQDARAEERIKAIEADKEMKGTYGMGKAKYLSQEFFPQLCKTIEDKAVLLVIVSQIRDNTDMFSFEKYSRSGGKALDFYCHMVIWLASAKRTTVERGEQKAITGGTNKLKVTKGKVPRPYRECFYTFMFDYGIDGIATGVDYLFDLRTKAGDISAPAAKVCSWEDDPSRKPLEGPAVRQWLLDNKAYDKYKGSLAEGEKYSLATALAFIGRDPAMEEALMKEFRIALPREQLIRYIEDHGLEDELDRRVEEKWESFEASLASGRRPKYFSQQPRSVGNAVTE